MDNKQIHLSHSQYHDLIRQRHQRPSASEPRESCTVLREKFPSRAGNYDNTDRPFTPPLTHSLRPTTNDELAWSIDSRHRSATPVRGSEGASEVGPSNVFWACGWGSNYVGRPARLGSVMGYDLCSSASDTNGREGIRVGWGRSLNRGSELPRKEGRFVWRR